MRVNITYEEVNIDIEANRSDLAHPDDPMMGVPSDKRLPDELASLILDVARPILFDVGLATGQIIMGKAPKGAVKVKCPTDHDFEKPVSSHMHGDLTVIVACSQPFGKSELIKKFKESLLGDNMWDRDRIKFLSGYDVKERELKSEGGSELTIFAIKENG